MTAAVTTIPNASPTTTRITGVAAILAPILMLASTVAFVTEGNGINDGKAGGAIGVWSCFAFLLAFAGLYRVLEPAAPRAAPILFAVAAIGSAAGVGFNVDALLAAEFGRDAVDAASEASALSMLAYLPWGLFFPIGVVATGILMRRTGTFPGRAAVLVVAGGVLFVASRPSRLEPLAVAADCVLVLGFVPIGWSLLAGHRATTPQHSTTMRMEVGS